MDTYSDFRIFIDFSELTTCLQHSGFEDITYEEFCTNSNNRKMTLETYFTPRSHYEDSIFCNIYEFLFDDDEEKSLMIIRDFNSMDICKTTKIKYWDNAMDYIKQNFILNDGESNENINISNIIDKKYSNTIVSYVGNDENNKKLKTYILIYNISS
jgi:hypothetical protein